VEYGNVEYNPRLQFQHLLLPIKLLSVKLKGRVSERRIKVNNLVRTGSRALRPECYNCFTGPPQQCA